MKKYVLVLFFSICLFILAGYKSAFAGTGDNLAGYAWSSNIGWISFNCTNDSSCGTADYGVNMNADGTLTGYAWSSNIGWIQFGSFSGFPSGGGGTQSVNAQVNGNNTKGWIRALSNGGGWDGWISLSGAGYGVNFSGTTFTGYAWGSDVIDWMLFDVQNVYPAICSSCGVSLSGDATLDIKSGGASGTSILGNTTVSYGTVPTFVWTLTNVSGTTCSVSKTSGSGTSFTTVSGINTSGSITGLALTGSSTADTYQINCTNPTISHQVGFTVAAQPAAFSLGGPENVNIKFLKSGRADSVQKTFFVNPAGGFSSSVSVSVSGTTCPGTTKYSLGGGTYAFNPTAVNISSPYSAGNTFKARFTQIILNSCDVTLHGTDGGSLSSDKIYTIVPASSTPAFQEL